MNAEGNVILVGTRRLVWGSGSLYVYMYFLFSSFSITSTSNTSTSNLGGRNGKFSFHLNHQVNIGLFRYETSKDKRTGWRHLSTTTGTTPHYLVNTEGNVNL